MKTIDIGSIISDDKQNYKIESLLGKGGFAVAYKAIGDDGLIYAVKVIQYPAPENLKSFYNEYNIATSIHSEHAIRYYYLNEYGKNDYPCFIIMEFADGGDLTTMLEKRSGILFTADELKSIFLQLIDAMIDVSSVAVHRDIKPDNILLSNSTGSLLFKISDYGIAKFEGADTRTETFKGFNSVFYHAPELIRDPYTHGLNTIKVDMYAMGIVFYEIANLRYPYGDKESFVSVKAVEDAHLTCQRQKFENSVDPVYKAMISKMIEKSPKDRYVDWTEIKNYLMNSSIGQGIKRSSMAEDIIRGALANDDAEKKKALEESKKKTERENAFMMLLSDIESKIGSPQKRGDENAERCVE